MSVIQQINDDWLPVQSRPRVIFQFAPNLLFSGICLSCRFWRISGNLVACFPGLATRHRTEVSNPFCSAIQSGLCPASPQGRAFLTRIQADAFHPSAYPARNPELLFAKIALELPMFSNADLGSSGLPD